VDRPRRFYHPTGVALDPRDGSSLLVTDQSNFVIRRVTARGDVTTVAGRPCVPGALNGPVASATLYNPSGIAAARDGTIFVSEVRREGAVRRTTSERASNERASDERATREQATSEQATSDERASDEPRATIERVVRSRLPATRTRTRQCDKEKGARSQRGRMAVQRVKEQRATVRDRGSATAAAPVSRSLGLSERAGCSPCHTPPAACSE
jgi:hypothetical protein